MEVTERPQATNLSQRAQEDYELVLSAIDGNQKSYASLMDRYRNSIFHMMMKMVSNREDADDLTLEAFGKAFNKLPSYAPRYAFSTWLFKIAINNCIDHIRKKRLKMLSIDDPIEPEGDHNYSTNIRSTALDPEEQFIRQQRLKLMRTVLNKLNLKYRLMIELRFFEELSYDEIAQELDIPLGTVKAQLFRAKEILFNILQQPGASAYIDTPRGNGKGSKARSKSARSKKATAKEATVHLVKEAV
ncbi:MAG: RNA polymerase sigma factor (sigma-70 family) [Polaribacter sp.]|jgi:RNA polymerase sigma factor (sigma-70 family)